MKTHKSLRKRITGRGGRRSISPRRAEFVRGSVWLEEEEWEERRPPDSLPQLSKGLEGKIRSGEQGRAESTTQ